VGFDLPVAGESLLRGFVEVVLLDWVAATDATAMSTIIVKLAQKRFITSSQTFRYENYPVEFNGSAARYYTAMTSRSGSISCFSMPSIAIKVPLSGKALEKYSQAKKSALEYLAGNRCSSFLRAHSVNPSAVSQALAGKPDFLRFHRGACCAQLSLQIDKGQKLLAEAFTKLRPDVAQIC
jgi:hypothetical protein